MKKFIVFVLGIIFISCNGKKSVEMTTSVTSNDVTLSENESLESELEIKTDSETDSENETHVIMGNIQNEEIEVVEPLSELLWDDSAYNDKATVEFNLQNTKNQNFCLYHNIHKIKDFNLDDKEDVLSSNWSKIDKEDFTVFWNDTNGAIVRITTSSPKWQTKRGVKVGDTVQKVMEAYFPDSEVYVYDVENEKYNVQEDKTNNIFFLYQSDDYISVNAGNMVEEEMMTIVFFISGGIVSKIGIICGDQQL